MDIITTSPYDELGGQNELIPQNSFLSLPDDIIDTVLMNLDVQSFFKMTSTCRQLANKQQDLNLLKHITNCPASTSSTEDSLKHYKILRTSEIIEDLFGEKLATTINKQTRVRCGLVGRRLLQNICTDLLSVILLFLFLLLGGLTLDRKIGSNGVIVVIALLIIFQVVTPFLSSFLGILTKENEFIEHMYYNNRDIKLYNGAFSYFRQIYYNSKKRSFLHFIPLVILSTLILFCFYFKQLVSGFVLFIPITTYLFFFSFCGCFSFNLLPWAWSSPKFEFWWLTRVIPHIFLMFTSLFLCVLHGCGAMDGFFSCYLIPLHLSFLTMTFESCITNFLALCSFNKGRYCYLLYGCYNNKMDGFESEEACECSQCWGFSFSFWYLSFVVAFIGLKLDGLVDWYWSTTFIPLEVLLCFLFASCEFSIALAECVPHGCECCYYVFDNDYISFWRYPKIERILKCICCTHLDDFQFDAIWQL